MATQVALFRGINVGKAKRIAMADLRAMFEALGYTEVRTLLNSGNVVFDAGRSTTATNAKRIVAALTGHTGVSANAVVVGSKTLDAAIACNPFLDRMDDPSRMLVGFIAESADRAPLQALVESAVDEHVALGADALYLWCPDGILDSAFATKLVGPKFRDLVTSRNWSTVIKLQALAGRSD
ncbi:MAG: DUF1697 domain-containing protein [Lysobacteraceae bacterium]